MNAMRLYLAYLGMSLRGQLQYRASSVLAIVGQFLTTLIEFAGIWALFSRFGGVQGWSLPQVAVFYGLVNGGFAVADALSGGFDRFGSDFVKTGNFDRLLLRPRGTVLQLAGHELTLRRAGRLLTGLLVFAWGQARLDLSWGLAQVGLLALTVIGLASLFFGLLVLQATMAFWTTESLEVWHTLTYGGIETAQYPLSIYERWFRRFFIYVVPLGCVSYFPVVALLGVEDPLGSSRGFQVMAPLFGVVFLIGALQVWKLGVRRYTSTGS